MKMSDPLMLIPLHGGLAQFKIARQTGVTCEIVSSVDIFLSNLTIETINGGIIEFTLLMIQTWWKKLVLTLLP